MYVIICGLGQVGYKVLEEFVKLEEEIVVISTEIKKDREKLLRKNNIKSVIGDARELDILREAGIDNARALIAVTGNDVVNIEISLNAKSLNSSISTIVRMYDEVLADRIESGFGIQRALSTPALAASAYASAVLSDKICEFLRFGKQNIFLFEWIINERSTLLNKTVKQCRQYLDIEPILIKSNMAEQAEIPHESYKFELRDKVLFFSTSTELLKLTGEKFKGKYYKKQAVNPLGDKIEDVFSGIIRYIKSIPGTIRALITIFSLFILVSAWIFHKSMGWSVLDSFYFVLSTSATVGYGDFNLKHAVPWVKLFGCLVIISGPAFIAGIFGLFIEMMVDSKVNEYFGLNKQKLKNHIVVAGLGNLGYRIADSLTSVGEKVVAIEKKAESEARTIMKGKIPIITGDARSMQILGRIGIDKAKALVAVTDDAMTNLGIALHAKEYNPEIKTVIRIFDREFGQRIKDNYGIDSVLSSSQLVSSTFSAVLIDQDVVKSFWWNNNHIVILIKDIKRKSFLRGLNKQEATERYQIVPIICRNKHGYKQLDVHYKIAEGDQVVIVSTYETIKKLNEEPNNQGRVV